jgi:uncharacterized protein
MADGKLANPGALGLGAFAMTTFTLNIVNAGLISKDNLGIVLPLGLFYGGLAQFMAGMWDVKRGDIFGATCFTSYAAFWMAVALMIVLEMNGVIQPVPREGMAVLFISWGLFSVYATIAAFKVSKAVFIVFVLLCILFFMLAIGEWNADIHKIAGYEGILTAVLAWYCSAGILINDMYGREVLPMGHAKPAK